MVERTQMNSQQAIAKTCLKSGENLNIFFFYEEQFTELI